MKSAKEQELKKKEVYLRQLQEELNAKENQISAKIRSEATLNPYSKEAASKAEISHFIKPYVNPFPGVEPTPKNESSFEKKKVEVQGVPQSQTAALPRPQEEETTDKSKQAQTEQT